MKKLFFIIFSAALIVATVSVEVYPDNAQNTKPNFGLVKMEDGSTRCIMAVYGVDGNCSYDLDGKCFEQGNVVADDAKK